MFAGIDWTPFRLSFELASVTTLILFFLSLPVAWWLSRTQRAIKPFVEALVSMPIVLPPSVLGFYILWGFSHDSPLGRLLENYFDMKLLFSFEGLVAASVIYSFPFMVQPIQSGFESLGKSMIEASYLAGKNTLQTLFYVALPNIKPSLITATVITFAHTVGEFGVVLMVGGSIPGETKVASVAIYELVEKMDYTTAHIYSGVMVLLIFVVLLGVYGFNRSKSRKMKGSRG